MVLDEIDGFLSSAASALSQGSIQLAALQIAQAQGIIRALLDEATKWERIRHAYQGGARPADLAERYGVTSQAIRSRATRYGWPNPHKLAKVASIKKNKNIMHIVCKECEHYFETTSGHAKVCPTCKALENMGRQA